MFYVAKGKLRYGVADENMLSPFLTNGYILVNENAPVTKPTIESVVEPIVEVKVEEPKAYTKTDILRASLDELRKIAKANGIKVKPNDTGACLKKILIETLMK